MLTNIAARGLRTSLALASLAASVVASAATQTLDFDLTPSFGAGDMLGSMARTNWYSSLGVGKFDGSLGTLSSVTIRFDYSGHIDGSITNDSASPGLVDVYLGHSLAFGLNSIGGGINYGDFTVLNYDTYSVIPTQLDQGDNLPYSFDVTGSHAYSFTTADAFFASQFIGSGLLDFEGAAMGDAWQFVGAPMDTHVNTFASIKGQVIYNYDPIASVPAPPAFLAMGLGALRLGRRRKARASA